MALTSPRFSGNAALQQDSRKVMYARHVTGSEDGRGHLLRNDFAEGGVVHQLAAALAE